VDHRILTRRDDQGCRSTNYKTLLMRTVDELAKENDNKGCLKASQRQAIAETVMTASFMR
jgi:hypothetical protein